MVPSCLSNTSLDIAVKVVLMIWLAYIVSRLWVKKLLYTWMDLHQLKALRTKKHGNSNFRMRFILVAPCDVQDLSSPTMDSPGIEPMPPAGKHGVLNTGLPGNSWEEETNPRLQQKFCLSFQPVWLALFGLTRLQCQLYLNFQAAGLPYIFQTFQLP